MQRVFREQLVERTADYAERIRGLRRSDVASGPVSVLDRLVSAGIGALEHLRGATPPEQLERAVALLAGAEVIHVVGQRHAFGVAAYMAYAIGQLGLRAHLLDGSADDHASGGPHARDAADRRKLLALRTRDPGVCRGAFDGSAPIIALADGPLSPLLPLAKVAFEIEDAELQGFPGRCLPLCAWR